MKGFVFSSTGGCVYGEPLYIPIDEVHPLQPIDPFGEAGVVSIFTSTMLEDKDIPFIPEAFIDRTYKEDLTLVDRSEEGSVLISVEEQINQARSIVCDEKIMSNNNKILNYIYKSIKSPRTTYKIKL